MTCHMTDQSRIKPGQTEAVKLRGHRSEGRYHGHESDVASGTGRPDSLRETHTVFHPCHERTSMKHLQASGLGSLRPQPAPVPVVPARAYVSFENSASLPFHWKPGLVLSQLNKKTGKTQRGNQHRQFHQINILESVANKVRQMRSKTCILI